MVLIPWLKKARPSDPLAVSMTGVKLGDRLLIVGCRDRKLIAQLAAKPGLTGRTCILDEDAAQASHAARAAERDGALVETFIAPWTSVPSESDSFDIVVIRDVLAELPEDRRAGCASEVRRILRAGGRCLVIEAATARILGGLTGRRSANPAYVESGGAVRALETAGFVAVRVLAERGRLLFVEGIKRNE